MTSGPIHGLRDQEDQRINAIRERLSTVRDRTLLITERARDAAAHAMEARSAGHASCNHAAEAQEMRTELELAAHELEGLRVAMQTRGVIEQAKGMLMLQQHCDADTAFATLVSMSQTGHLKLIDVARTMVTAWSEGNDGDA